ncbi:MAG: toxin Bro [Firmicutes bacterium]|nr:toxin Bro [Bacillota bacterium]
MMNEIKIFENSEFGQIRIIEKDGEPWFIGKEIAEILGYSNTRDALALHVDIEDKNTVAFSDGKRGNPNQTIINESGLYSLILSSKLPNAKKFKRWVTSEVLPLLRKNGSYDMKKSKTSEEKSKLAEARLMNAKTRMSNQFLKLANVNTLSKEYKNILVAKAAEILAGEPLISLPKSRQKTYSAKEIGAMFNISANKVGRIANMNGLKVSEYGEYYRSKSEHSNKEVDTWVYFDSVIPVFAKLLERA